MLFLYPRAINSLLGSRGRETPKTRTADKVCVVMLLIEAKDFFEFFNVRGENVNLPHLKILHLVLASFTITDTIFYLIIVHLILEYWPKLSRRSNAKKKKS